MSESESPHAQRHDRHGFRASENSRECVGSHRGRYIAQLWPIQPCEASYGRPCRGMRLPRAVVLWQPFQQLEEGGPGLLSQICVLNGGIHDGVCEVGNDRFGGFAVKHVSVQIHDAFRGSDYLGQHLQGSVGRGFGRFGGVDQRI